MSGPAVGQSSEITVEGGGSDIWNEADEFHYYFTDVGANFDAVAKNVMVRTTPDHTSLQWQFFYGRPGIKR